MTYHIPCKPRLLSLLVAACAAPLAAQAQEPEITEIVTYASPIRDSQIAAMEAKRDADNFLDIVAADTIGRFPDQNLADSLGRMPGLAIERDQGQARYINFRGAPFRYTSLAIDGLLIPGAENGRVPRFDAFPAVITSRIEANKAVMPNMPGESVSGYINIESFSPFDVEGWSASADFGAGEQALGGGDVGRQSLRLSWSDENFGFSVFASNNEREQTTDNRELDLTIDEQTDDLIANELDLRSYKVKRMDSAWGGRLEYRPSNSLNRFFFSSLYSEFVDEEERNQFVFDLAGGAEAVGQSLTAGNTGYLPLALTSRSLEFGKYDNSTFTNTLGADLELGEWLVEARLNQTKTENNTFLPISMSVGGQVAAGYDINDLENPLLDVMAPFTTNAMNIADIDYALTLALIIDSNLDIEANKFKLDGERSISLFNRPATLRLGVEQDQREARGVGFALGQNAFPSSLDIDAYNTGTPWETDFTNSIGGTYYDNKGLRAAWDQAVGGIGVAPPENERIAIDEDLTAAYAMATTDLDWGNFVVGARVERTDYSSQGPLSSYSDTLTHVLPSAHLNIDLREDVKLRFAATTAISRPTYTEWRASATIDPVDREVSGGNPSLEPEEARGLDASLEWYYGNASMMAFGAFHRDIEHVIYADSSTIDGGVYLPTAAGENWSYTGFINGRDGSMSGLEFNIIAQASDFIDVMALDGFGVTANMTLLDSEFTTQTGNKFSLPGTSDAIYNASVYYETEALSIRLNYQYRDDWLSTTENDAFAEYWAAQTRVDLSAKYDLPWQLMGTDLSLYFNANNLNDAVDVRYSGTPRTPNQVERYGRYYMAGIRANF